MNVGLVSLGEAGNYGDDLILLAVLNSISLHDRRPSVSFTSFGRRLPLERIHDHLALPEVTTRVSLRRDLPGTTHLTRNFSTSDIIFVGGGGLFQTSHHPLRPYHWLRHLPRSNAPVIGVGLGLGPLSTRWERYFRNHSSPFDRLAVRDDHSATLARDFGWTVERCKDFIDDGFLRHLTCAFNEPSDDGALGVALRSWPGLTVEDTARHIDNVASAHDAQSVEYFVLESIQGSGPDVDFTRAVASATRRPGNSRIHVYSSDNFIEFTRALMRPTVAVSMKIHSSAFWAHSGIPLYPIVYAPKIASFFNRLYNGLEIVNEPTVVSDRADQSSPRAQSIVHAALDEPFHITETTRHAFGAAERFRFQTESLALDAYAKLQRH